MPDQEPNPQLDRIAEEIGDAKVTDVRSEEDFLERQGRSSALRAVVSNAAHVQSLEQERDRLAAELSEARDRLESVLPRVAELEQAERNAQQNVWLATTVLTLGGALMSLNGYVVSPL